MLESTFSSARKILCGASITSHVKVQIQSIFLMSSPIKIKPRYFNFLFGPLRSARIF